MHPCQSQEHSQNSRQQQQGSEAGRAALAWRRPGSGEGNSEPPQCPFQALCLCFSRDLVAAAQPAGPLTPATSVPHSLSSNTPRSAPGHSRLHTCSPLCLACTSLLHLANACSSLERPCRCHLLQEDFSDCPPPPGASHSCWGLPHCSIYTHHYNHLLICPPYHQ